MDKDVSFLSASVALLTKTIQSAAILQEAGVRLRQFHPVANPKTQSLVNLCGIADPITALEWSCLFTGV
jgi:hypothetical protein